MNGKPAGRRIREGTPFEPFRLVRRDDDLEPNQTLRHHLQEQFQIALPDPEEEGGFVAYLDAVERPVGGQSGWEVLQEAHLSQLQFNRASRT